MQLFAEFLAGIDNPGHKERTEEVLTWVNKKFPKLVPKIKWNQPMFTDHGTYIIGFSVSKQHLAVAPERAVMEHFSEEIVKTGLGHTKELIRMKWNLPFNYELLEKMIEFNIWDKADCSTFWRK